MSTFPRMVISRRCVGVAHWEYWEDTFSLLVWRNWQTRQTQNLLIEISCGFESHHEHHFDGDMFMNQVVSFYAKTRLDLQSQINQYCKENNANPISVSISIDSDKHHALMAFVVVTKA